MPVLHRGFVAAALVVMLSSGCADHRDNRINAAIPVANEVALAKTALESEAKSNRVDLRAIEDEFHLKMKQRASQCTRNYHPSWWASDASIREGVGNAKCFDEFDRKLQQWLNLRRIGLRLSLPPAHFAPESPNGILTADGDIQDFVVAERAGVAVALWSGRYQVFDLGNGSVLHDGVMEAPNGIALSANGRLLAGGLDDTAQIQDSETGEVLAIFPDVWDGRLFWAGTRGVIYTRASNDKTMYRDLDSGREIVVPTKLMIVQSVLDVPGSPATYALLSSNSIAKLVVRNKPDGDIELSVEQRALEGIAKLDRDDLQVSTQGNIYVSGGAGIEEINLKKLSARIISLEPMQVTRVMATRDADHLLLTGYVPGFGTDGAQYIYSLTDRTLAHVNREELLRQHLIFIPAMRRYAILTGRAVLLIDEPPSIEPVAAATVLEQLASPARRAMFQATERQQTKARAEAVVSTSGPGASTRAMVRAPVAAPVGPSGQAGLFEAMRSGVLRLGNSGDVDRWRWSYEAKSGKKIDGSFNEFIEHRPVYVITGNFTVPSGLSGGDSVVFVLDYGAPFPQGDSGHSPILDVSSGSCFGSLCFFLGR